MLQAGTSNEGIFRDGPWKIIIKFENKTEMFLKALYNLEKDAHENNNLLDMVEYKSRAEKMFEKYKKIRTEKLATRSL